MGRKDKGKGKGQESNLVAAVGEIHMRRVGLSNVNGKPACTPNPRPARFAHCKSPRALLENCDGVVRGVLTSLHVGGRKLKQRNGVDVSPGDLCREHGEIRMEVRSSTSACPTVNDSHRKEQCSLERGGDKPHAASCNKAEKRKLLHIDREEGGVKGGGDRVVGVMKQQLGCFASCPLRWLTRYLVLGGAGGNAGRGCKYSPSVRRGCALVESLRMSKMRTYGSPQAKAIS